MVDLSEVVGNVQLESVVLDVGNGVVAMNEDICTPVIDKLRTDMVAMKKKAMSRYKLFQSITKENQQFQNEQLCCLREYQSKSSWCV